MRALVTGCGGFIGSSLTDRLLAQGHDVVGIDSFDDYYDPALKRANLAGALRSDGFELVEADLVEIAAAAPRRTPRLTALLRSVDRVFHLAAQPGVRGSWGRDFDRYVRNNIVATQLLLECAKDTRIDSLVCASSSSVYGTECALPMEESAECRPFSPYGVTKLASEHLARLYARNFGMPVVCLRFFTVYGPRQRPDMGFSGFIRAALDGRPLTLFGDGRQTRDFTYVSDIVDGIVSAPMAPAGSVLNLGGGARVSLVEALATLADVMGREIRLEPHACQAGDVTDTLASIARARDTIGYRPRVGLRDGLRRQFEWTAERDREPVAGRIAAPVR